MDTGSTIARRSHFRRPQYKRSEVHLSSVKFAPGLAATLNELTSTIQSTQIVPSSSRKKSTLGKRWGWVPNIASFKNDVVFWRFLRGVETKEPN